MTREALDYMLFEEIPHLERPGSRGGGVVEQSDGASNLTCKEAVRMNYLNPFVVCVLISVEGMHGEGRRGPRQRRVPSSLRQARARRW